MQQAMYNFISLLSKNKLDYRHAKTQAEITALLADKKLYRLADTQLLNYSQWLNTKKAA